MKLETIFLFIGLGALAAAALLVGIGYLWYGFKDALDAARKESQSAARAGAECLVPPPPQPAISPTTPATVLRAAMARSDESALAWAERINQLIKPSFLIHAAGGSHIQVQFVFSPTGFTEVCWQAYGEDYCPRVKCFRDGELIFSESGRRGSMGDYLEPGMRYRFRFEVSSDSSTGAVPVHDIERYILVPTKQMLLARVDDDLADAVKGVCGVDLSDPEALQAAVESFFNQKK